VASNLNVTVTGELLKFDQPTLTAKANAPVNVTLKNGSAAQKHNWVLVKDEAAAGDIATKATGTNGDPPNDPAILAKVGTVVPGATESDTFTSASARHLRLPLHRARPLSCWHEGHPDSQLDTSIHVSTQSRRMNGIITSACFCISTIVAQE
jgi:hypothetical protein